MEFMDHLYQFGQFGILTFRDGIQEVSGSIPIISTKNLRNLRISEVFLFYGVKCGVLSYFSELPNTYLTTNLIGVVPLPECV